MQRFTHISEAQFQGTVEGMLDVYGWDWIHHRAGRTKNGSYTVAVSGNASRGFPDLLCFRGSDSLALECKKQDGRVRPEQHKWIQRLSAAGIEARVVRPSDLDWLEQRLKPDPTQLTMTSNSTDASWYPLKGRN